MNRIIFLLALCLAACSAAPAAQPSPAGPTSLPSAQTAPTAPANLLKIHSSAAVQAWQADAFTCADSLGLVLQDVPDPARADLALELGEPAGLTTPAFKIGQEDLLVVANRVSPLQNMDQPAVQALFAHPDTQKVQIWVYAPGEDVQQIFEKSVMQGQTISSFALVAVSPQQMSDQLNKDPNALGILPRHWKAGSLREVFSLPNLPVLAVVKEEPQGALKNLLACLQTPK